MQDPPATILIVDDRDANLLALEAVLEPLGHRLVKARSGREALRFLLEQDCALILLDVQMPELDGFETAALIRERERTRYTPIIFVTAVRREEEEILKGYANGAVDYVIKPFAPETMVAKVRAFLEIYRHEQSLRREAALRAQERDEFERRERRARAEADAHREHLYALFMKAPAAISIVRGPEQSFVLANPRFEEMVGRKNLMGRPGREAIPEPEAQPTWDILDEVQRTGDPFLGNEVPALWGMSGEDGSQRFFNFVAQPTRMASGETESVMVHAVEVTDSVAARRRSEALAKRLLETDRNKDEFLAILGHELRNPLAPILTALHVMRLRSSDPSTEAERAVIERQVSHLSRLVDDLLDISRATMGKIDLRRERLDLAAAVARAVEMSRPAIEARKHHLEVDVPVGGLFVEGDLVRLAQVIGNLLQNAARYTDPGGHIRVEGRRESGEMVLRVRDDGAGIPRERLSSMFDLFVQGDPEGSSRGGLGIGLTLVRSLVQLHGGTVEAFSEGPGKGTEFVVRLPASSRESERPPPPKPAARAISHQPRRVLVVDDDVDSTEMLSRALSAVGHEVRQEHDGASALVAAAQFQPDVVLLDLGLPGMGGIEVARRLRELPELSSVRIVALTGRGEPRERSRTAAAGIEAHLVKPVDLDTIIEAIAMQGNRAEPQA
ncbi:MAG TPA: response regulator [Myxococcales bacterium]|nr:response regulator [Myxococcales bacterium]